MWPFDYDPGRLFSFSVQASLGSAKGGCLAKG